MKDGFYWRWEELYLLLNGEWSKWYPDVQDWNPLTIIPKYGQPIEAIRMDDLSDWSSSTNER